MEPGTGHHHLVVDAELPTAGSPIPATPGVHIHMGQAQTEYELTGLTAGEPSVKSKSWLPVSVIDGGPLDRVGIRRQWIRESSRPEGSVRPDDPE